MKNKNIVVRILSNVYVKNILLMFLVFIGLIVLTLICLKFYTKHNESVVVPALKGLQVEDVASILKSHNLEYEIIDSVFQTKGAPGAIIEQIPIEKSKVKKGRTIFLVVQARNKQLVAIPSLQDFSQRQALAQLNALGFVNIDIEEVPSVYSGIVLAVRYNGVEVTPGQKIPKGSRLVMRVGAGGESYVIEGDTTVNAEENTEITSTNVEKSFFE